MSIDKAAWMRVKNLSRDLQLESENIASGLMRWRSELADVKTGVSVVKNINVVGDSISEGGISGVSATDYINNGYVATIRKALATKYGDVGIGFIPTHYPNNNTQFWSAGWVADGYGVGSKGRESNTGGATLTFSFSGTGVALGIVKHPTGGEIDYSIDGGAQTGTINSYNSTVLWGVYQPITTTLSDGNHTITLTKKADTKTSWVFGATPLKGTKGIRVNHMAAWGQRAEHFSSTAPLAAEFDVLVPSLTLVALEANDYQSQTSLSVYKTKIQDIITRAKLVGDVLVVANGLRTESGPIAQSEYTQTLRALALLNNCAFISINDRWGGDSNFAKNTLSYIYDTVHPNARGHQDIATAILKVIDEY